jgi:hypothetical protein
MCLMPPTRAEALQLLAEYAGAPRPSGPVPLSEAYLQAIQRWEALPENAEGSQKAWVLLAERSWRRSMARSRLVD